MDDSNVILFSEIVKLLEVVIWPLVLMLVLLFYKKQIPKLISQIGGRVKKISIPNLFELELSHVEEAKINWSPENFPDIRQATSSSEFSSYAPSLIQEIQKETKGEYAIIDLGNGKSWLTSRLFLFATLLKQIKGLENYVILETIGGVQRKFIGIVNSDAIRWNFALHYPWLEESYLTACQEQEMNDPALQKPGIITTEQAGNMVTGFLQNIQLESYPIEAETNEWVPIGEQGFYEHSKWINSNLLFDVLGDNLKTNCITDTFYPIREDKYGAIAMQKGKYVALIDNRGEFKSLIDRERIIEEVGKNIVLQNINENE